MPPSFQSNTALKQPQYSSVRVLLPEFQNQRNQHLYITADHGKCEKHSHKRRFSPKLFTVQIHPSLLFRIRYGHYHTIRQTDNAFIFRGNRFLMHTQFVRTVRFFHICFSIADHQNIRGFPLEFLILQSAAVTGNRFHTLLPLSSPPQKLPVSLRQNTRRPVQ